MRGSLAHLQGIVHKQFAGHAHEHEIADLHDLHGAGVRVGSLQRALRDAPRLLVQGAQQPYTPLVLVQDFARQAGAFGAFQGELRRAQVLAGLLDGWQALGLPLLLHERRRDPRLRVGTDERGGLDDLPGDQPAHALDLRPGIAAAVDGDVAASALCENRDAAQHVLDHAAGGARVFAGNRQVVRTENDGVAREIEQGRDRIAAFQRLDAEHAHLRIDGRFVPLLPVARGPAQVACAEPDLRGHPVAERLHRRRRELLNHKITEPRLIRIVIVLVIGGGGMVVNAGDQHVARGNAGPGFYLMAYAVGHVGIDGHESGADDADCAVAVVDDEGARIDRIMDGFEGVEAVSEPAEVRRKRRDDAPFGRAG